MSKYTLLTYVTNILLLEYETLLCTLVFQILRTLLEGTSAISSKGNLLPSTEFSVEKIFANVNSKANKTQHYENTQEVLTRLLSPVLTGSLFIP